MTRSDDRGRVAAWWGRWGRDLTTFVAVGLSAYAVIVAGGNSTAAKNAAKVAKTNSEQNRAALVAINKESAERRDDSCRIFETKQKNDVNALAQTYRYLGGLPKGALDDALNKAVLAQLPATIREAQTDDAPAYCDAPGIGLPEPDPMLPKRPPNVPAPK